MIKLSAVALTSALLVIASARGGAAADPTGIWLTENKDALVRIAACGGALCGTIVWLKDPIDAENGKPWTDKNNSDPANRTRSIVGLLIFSGMKPSATVDQWDGQVYSIDRGKSYDGNLILKSATNLRIQGCFLAFCEGEDWTRQEEAVAPKTAPAPQRRP